MIFFIWHKFKEKKSLDNKELFCEIKKKQKF